MAVLMFSTPFVTLAQQNSVRAEAEAAAERDAEARTNKPVWFLLGCVGGIFTVAVVYFIEPSIPAGALLGKSPEYVAFYTDAYISKARSIQMQVALGGCITNCMVSAVIYVALGVGSIAASAASY